MTIYNLNTNIHSRTFPWWICKGTYKGRHIFGAGRTIAIALRNAFNS